MLFIRFVFLFFRLFHSMDALFPFSPQQVTVIFLKTSNLSRNEQTMIMTMMVVVIFLRESSV